MKKLTITLFIITAIMIMSCASMMSKDGTTESRAVADYKSLAIKLSDTRNNIDNVCPTSSNKLSTREYRISKVSCRKVKRIFNYAVKTHVIAGEYLKILADPGNKSVYMLHISTRMLSLMQKSEHDRDMKHIITAVNEIVQAKHEDPLVSADMILSIAIERLLPVTAGILQPYIVEE